MLKGGDKAIDFSEDNIFLLFSLRFRGYETHHKTPLLIYLGIKTVLKKKTTKTETLDLNQIWVYRKHNLGVVVVLWFFWYLYPNERLKLHCKRAHLFVSYFVFFFSIDSDTLNIDKKLLKLNINMYMLGTFPGMLRWLLKKLATFNVETSDLNFQSGYLQSNDAQTVTK